MRQARRITRWTLAGGLLVGRFVRSAPARSDQARVPRLTSTGVAAQLANRHGKVGAAVAVAVAMAAGIAAAAGCAEPVRPIEPQVTSRAVYFEVPVRVPVRLDLLFVIDNSPAMAEHQANLSANLANFINVLSTIEGGLPSVHIGVITTDVGTEGRDGSPGPTVAGCAGDGDGGRLREVSAVAGRFLIDHVRGDGTRARNYQGTLGEAFTELATVGAEGCAYTRPLEAMRRALDGNPATAGFLRDHAFLAVIFVTARDDCSFTSGGFVPATVASEPDDAVRCFTHSEQLIAVADDAAFLRAQKPDPGHVMVGLIAGPDAPVELALGPGGFEVVPGCTWEGTSALPAPRLHALRSGFVNRSTATSLCQGNLSDALVLVAGFGRSFGNPCLEVPLLDLDPATPGTQPDCAVWYRFPATSGLDDRLIPACTASGRPCWYLDRDPLNCPTGNHELIQVLPSADDLPAGTRFMGNCLVE